MERLTSQVASPHTKPLATYSLNLVIPAYNEAERPAYGHPNGYYFANYLDRLNETFTNHFENEYALTVVDDGSLSGATSEIARDRGARVITYDTPGNRGRGAAYQLGFLQAANNAKVIATADADGSYDPETILDLYNAVKHGRTDMAIAYRSENLPNQHEDFKRKLGHTVLRSIRELLAPTGLRDTQAGAFALTSNAARFLFQREINQGWSANHQIARIAKLAGLTIEEVAAEIIPREGSRVGTSITKLGAQAIKMFFDTARIGVRYRSSSGLKQEWLQFSE